MLPIPIWAIVLGAIVLVLSLLAAVVVVRLARQAEIPHPPIGLEVLGTPPPTSALDVIARESRRLSVRPGPEEVHERFLESSSDDALVVDEAVRAAMREVDRAHLDDLAQLVDAIHSGAPMGDRCADLDARCPGIEIVRASQSDEIVVIDRWFRGDRHGASALLTRMLVAWLELAQTGRAVMSQVVGVSTLLRATGLVVMLQRDGLVIEGPLRAALESVADAPIDLGRGWIVEMHRTEHALRTLPPHGLVEQLAFDRAATARALYVGQEACVRYARDPSAPRPAPLPMPTPNGAFVSSQTELALIEAILPECERMIDSARSRLDRSRDRARVLLARP